ncbi:carboxypeptidase regulatory domain-containing protein [Rhizobium phage RHph_I1_6]|uniref:Carboxypeptidase regulatory domain-containing protein n=1 Tax=Rhizobium phage RHph_I1_6 TaxID=2509728 RepID=A0A7S5V0L0_9CAUD|nr:carboxypeptidase regulatory domain-containing protein [Rhizobium phage RHph_I1_6]QIG76563.1 carboxypeptidase regulatory domain-containing protein [Rhizobium phage RHph_I1_6]
MSATITSANAVLTTLTVQGTGGTPGGQVGIYVDNVLRSERDTPDGSGNWEIVITNLTGGEHTVRATDIMNNGTSVITQFTPASITVETPAGDTTEDVTPVVQGTIEDTLGNPVNGATVSIYMKPHADSTYTLKGTTTTNSSGDYTFEIPTALQDGEYDFYAVATAVTLTSLVDSVTVSKPLEAPVMVPVTDRLFAIAADSIFIGINPPVGLEILNADTVNIAKPLGEWTIGGSSLGLAIDSTTGVVTIATSAQFAAAGSRQISITCTNSEGSSTALLNLVVVAEVSTTKYIDSVAGSDSNTGLNPNLPRANNDSSGNRRRYKRGGQWNIQIGTTDNLIREDYGDPWKPRPKFGSGATYGLDGANLDNAVVRSLWFSDWVSRGINVQVVTNMLIEDCLLTDSRSSSVTGIKLHNSDKAAALTVPDLPGKTFNLIYKDNEVRNVKGDGLYITKINGILIQNNKHDAAYGGGADCIQIAYENNDTNISRNVVIRGNLLLQSPQSQSDKGGLVCEQTRVYLVEYNDIGGKNFSFSSIGYDAVCRSNNMRDGKLSNYSFGYGAGEQAHFGRHHVYDNNISNCLSGIRFSSFGDSTILNNGVYGYQRYDFECHDNVISKCTYAFFADRPWSGYVKRNIFMQCTTGIQRQGGQVSGNTVANLGVYTAQDVTGNYTNDGTWLNSVPPTLSGSIAAGATVSVANAEWKLNGVVTVPDEVFYVWRNKGYDIVGETGTSYTIPVDAASDFELSCVMFARKGTNWMLAVAENDWPTDAYFIPRAYSEGALTFKKRYFKLGDVAA